jgi:ribosomal protein RSM22 (predicted rRNA methylase)
MQASNARTSVFITSYIYHSHTRRSKQSSHHQSQSESYSRTRKRLGRETSFMTPRAHKQEHNLHQVGESLFCHRILHTWLSKDYVIIKPSLENYEGLTDL